MNDKPKKIINGHIETLIPHFFRSVEDLDYSRVRIDTPDNDFLDLDFLFSNSDRLVVLSHGLESSSRAKYIQSMGKFLSIKGFDIVAWNCRGCSGEINKSLKYYHSGVSWDLREVINYINKNYDYKEIHLVGFSMGANITLKYLGEEENQISKNIISGCVFSAPCNLEHSSEKLNSGFSKLYTQNFLKTLKEKVKAKESALVSAGIDVKRVYRAKNMPVLDELLTAPLFGFKDASDYYAQSSSINYLQSIAIPTLIINAKNDPFLKGECYPINEASKNKNITLEIPQTGGHCGFMGSSFHENYWSENKCFSFLTQQ